MRRLLQNLRNKPSSTKRRIALGTSAAITGFIFVIWVTVISQGYLFNTDSLAEDSQVATPLSAFEDNAAAAFQQFFSSDNSTTTAATSTTTASEPTTTQPRPTIKRDREAYWEVEETNSGQETQDSQNTQDEQDFQSFQESQEWFESSN